MVYKNPSLTVDAIIYNIEKKEILVIKRKKPPFNGYYALIGGFVDYGEYIENACIREIKEEVNLDITEIYLFNVYSKPDRDPRGHTISIVFLAPITYDLNIAKAGDDAKSTHILKLNTHTINKLNFAFDHKEILMDFMSLLNNPGPFLKDRLPSHFYI